MAAFSALEFLSPVFVRFHQFVCLDLLSELLNMGTMAPRLRSNLLPDRRGETTRPLEAWIRIRYTLNRVRVYEILELARIV